MAKLKQPVVGKINSTPVLPHRTILYDEYTTPPDSLVQLTFGELDQLRNDNKCLGKEVYRLRDCLRVLASVCNANVEQSELHLEGV